MKKKIRLSKEEIKWLKGFTKTELEQYLKDYPIRKKTTEEFKRRYKYINNKWKRKLT